MPIAVAAALQVSISSRADVVGASSSPTPTRFRHEISVSYGNTSWIVQREFADFVRLNQLTEKVFDDDAMLPCFPEEDIMMSLGGGGSTATAFASQRAAASRNAICVQALECYLTEYLASWPAWSRRRPAVKPATTAGAAGAASDDVLTMIVQLPHPDRSNLSLLKLPVLLVKFLDIDAHVDCGAAYRAVKKCSIGPALFPCEQEGFRAADSVNSDSGEDLLYDRVGAYRRPSGEHIPITNNLEYTAVAATPASTAHGPRTRKRVSFSDTVMQR